MENMTLREALQGTRNLLAGVNVPAGMIRQIGMPILAAVENLEECIRAINAQGDGKGPKGQEAAGGPEGPEAPGKPEAAAGEDDQDEGDADEDGPAFGEGEI